MARTRRSQANNQSGNERNNNRNNGQTSGEPEGLATVVAWFLEIFANGQGTGSTSSGIANTFAQFSSQNPPMFDGKSDANVAENWLRRMEKIFKVLNCTENQKVEYTICNLNDVADEW